MAVVQRKEVNEAAKPTGPRIDEELMQPGKYEVTLEHTFDVEVCLLLRDNRWVVVAPKTPKAVEHKVTFRIWTYDEMVELRKKATNFDAMRRMHTVDTDLLDRLKVQKLMQSWTFDKDNPRLKIHRVNGVLTDEAWDNFKRLQANIIRYILDRMNEVLEYNG